MTDATERSKPPTTRADRGLAVAIVAAALSWLLIQEAPASVLVATASFLLIGLVATLTKRQTLREMGLVLLFLVASLVLSRFYRVDPLHTVGRIVRITLALPVGLTLGAYLLRALIRHAHHDSTRLLIAVSAIVTLLVGADLAFLRPWSVPFVHRVFHPWATFDIPNTYLQSNRRQWVVRDIQGVPFAQAKPKGTIRIVLAGSALAPAPSVIPEKQPARVLKSLLEAALPDRRIEVLTVAIHEKYMLNELVDAAVTLPHWAPDLVVSWNGFNDLWNGERDDRYEGEPVNGPLMDLTFSAGEIDAWLYLNTYFGQWLFERRAANYVSPYRLKDRDVYERSRFYDYLKRTSRLLRDADIPYLYAFPPTVSEKATLAPSEKALESWVSPADIAERRRVAMEVVRAEGQSTYDPTFALQSERPLFGDQCRLNDEGVQRAMAALAAEIVPRLRSDPGTRRTAAR